MEFEFIQEINHENIEFKETDNFLTIIIEQMNNDHNGKKRRKCGGRFMPCFYGGDDW